MASTTPYYGLKKPAYGEAADIADINDNMDDIDTALHDLDTAITGNKPIKCTKSGVSALPTTITKTGITATMQAVKMMLSAPYVQGSDWTITSAAGSITISGTITGSTDIEVWMEEVTT